jgi:D-alanyl-D-alanine carboxypeptidase/D-alanyl-D-alanine-endopeptidase (penicillin-binding protein 4)
LLALLGGGLGAASDELPTGRFSRPIKKLIEESPAVQRGRVGYEFVDAVTGEVLAKEDSERFFTPASNTKLYTTALALVKLGQNFKFQTQLATSGPWRPGQIVLSDLELIGGGDPELSSRVLPYRVQPAGADSGSPKTIPALAELADALVAAGIHEINGDVIGVSTRYPGDLYPNGWTIDDSLYGYGAPVTALAIEDNTISLTVRPTAVGELADVELRPVPHHFVVLNQVTTDASNAAHIRVSRRPGSSEVVIWGTIGQTVNAWRQGLGVDDPALLAAEALMEMVRERGIVVRGVARSEYRGLNALANPSEPNQPSGDVVLAAHDSAPLWEEIQLTNKISQNLHAEMLLREVALVTRGSGTLEAGVAAREEFLQEIGITREGTGFSLADGSGLARQDLTTPDSTVTLLRYMWQRTDRNLWLESLPIGGVDGTLEHRFQNIAGAERVHAKTGSIAHVNALSGYIEAQHGRWIAFSVMVNATAGHDSEVHDFIDQLCALFLRE